MSTDTEKCGACGTVKWKGACPSPDCDHEDWKAVMRMSHASIRKLIEKRRKRPVVPGATDSAPTPEEK